MPNMERQENYDCSCPFNAATGETGESTKIGLIYGQDPPTCLRMCREVYLGKISNSHEISAKACDILLKTTNRQQFHPLYWCDAILCGVWINPTGGLQQDPNVGLIINTCQNIGYFTIIDTGPPPLNYSCSFCDGESGEDSDPGQESNPSATTIANTSGNGSPIAPTSSSENSQDILPTMTVTAIATTPSPRISPSTADATADSKSQLSMGAKVAIGVCSAVAFIALTMLMLLLLRHRRRNRPYSPNIKDRIKIDHDFSRAPAGSPTPLISPVSTTDSRPPLTPPLRLRDRKLLPAILKPSTRSRSPPIGIPFDKHDFSQDRKMPFPISPICAPTTNKLEPRQAKVTSPHKSTSPRSAPPVSFSMPRSSLSSFATSGTMTANSSLRNEIMATTTNGIGISTIAVAESIGPTPPSSPTRPPRPHDLPLVIPDLVTGPLGPGPPPNRALPPPPPLSPPPGHGLDHSGSSAYDASLADLSKKTCDDQELVGARSRDTHGSWGSWTSPVDGGLGVGIGLALTKTHSSEVFPELTHENEPRSGHSTPVLHEEDLETLGGRY